MSHKHLPWKPSPAAKPHHLTSSPSPTTASPQSLAALQGAASAFASRPATTNSSVKQLRNQYEVSDVTSQLDIRRGRSPGESNIYTSAVATRPRSRSRGRHLSPEDAHVAGARSAISSSSPSTAAPLDRTPSMIAARLASASPSPVRGSGSGSNSPPKQSGTTSVVDHTDGVHSHEPRISTRPPAPSPRPSENSARTANPPTTANVDFDKIPKLVPTSTVSVAERQIPVLEPTESVPTLKQPKPMAPAPRMLRTMSDRSRPTSHDRRASPAVLAQPRPILSKPQPPAPRNRRDLAQSPSQPSPLAAQQAQGLSREEVINRMADAMVASSLASARTPSPHKSSRNFGGRRRSVSAHNLYRKPVVDETKLPSHQKAPRPMKQTLRKASPEDNDDTVEVTRRGRRHIMRKHPNMHHEGDRKRWRDRVTEAERRRYEGVFAANRGLLLKPADSKTSPSRLFDPNSEGNSVVNVVAKDIWERSRLPAQALEQIYDLVAPDEPLFLNREQFVVGLWLVDQKLKGRKLPVRVSESVWASVRHSQGIRVSSKTMQSK